MPNSSTARVAGPVSRRHAPAVALIRGLVALLVLAVSGCSTTISIADTGSTAGSSTASAGSRSGQASTGSAKAAGISFIATARGPQVSVRTAPGQGERKQLANPTAVGAPLTFLVLERRAGWLKVQLPLRPNGSSGWVAQDEVIVSTTPYRLVVSMSKHRLDVIFEGRRIARHDVGVGKGATPTPKGTYYLTELIQPPDPAGAYGPYAFGLSAFSNTLKTFAGGPGQLGLHGTDAPHGLGKDISHGCIRVANSVITQLAQDLPLGTPVDIQT